MKKNYEVKFDWVKSEKIDKVGLVTLNHENSLNPLSAGFVEAIYLSCKKFDDFTFPIEITSPVESN